MLFCALCQELLLTGPAQGVCSDEPLTQYCLCVFHWANAQLDRLQRLLCRPSQSVVMPALVRLSHNILFWLQVFSSVSKKLAFVKRFAEPPGKLALITAL